MSANSKSLFIYNFFLASIFIFSKTHTRNLKIMRHQFYEMKACGIVYDLSTSFAISILTLYMLL